MFALLRRFQNKQSPATAKYCLLCTFFFSFLLLTYSKTHASRDSLALRTHIIGFILRIVCVINLLMVSKKILLAMAIYLNYVWVSVCVSHAISPHFG